MYLINHSFGFNTSYLPDISLYLDCYFSNACIVLSAWSYFSRKDAELNHHVQTTWWCRRQVGTANSQGEYICTLTTWLYFEDLVTSYKILKETSIENKYTYLFHILSRDMNPIKQNKNVILNSHIKTLRKWKWLDNEDTNNASLTCHLKTLKMHN